MFRFLIFVFAIFAFRPAFALVDIESLRMKLHDSAYGGLASLSWNRKQGNSDTNQFAMGLQGLWKHNDFEYLASASREFGESNGERDTNRTVGHVRVTWPSERSLEGEVFTQVEQDEFRRLSDRELAGAGARIALSTDKDFLAYLGIGAMWSKETLSSAAGATDTGSNEFFRGDFYLSIRKDIAPNIVLTTVTYYQPDVRRVGDLWLFDDNELTFEANPSTSLALVYQLTYESRPPQTVQSADQTFGSVLKYKF